MTCETKKPKKPGTTWGVDDLARYGATYCIAAAGLHPQNPGARDSNEYTHSWPAAVYRAAHTGRSVYSVNPKNCFEPDQLPILRPGAKLKPNTVAIFYCTRCTLRQRIWSYSPGEFGLGQTIKKECPAECGSDTYQFEEYLA